MKTRKNGTTWSVRLGEECTIVDVEVHADKLRAMPDGLKKIVLHAGDVAEIDTAYLQALLSLKATAGDGGIDFQVRSASEAVERICRLYNIAL